MLDEINEFLISVASAHGVYHSNRTLIRSGSLVHIFVHSKLIPENPIGTYLSAVFPGMALSGS